MSTLHDGDGSFVIIPADLALGHDTGGVRRRLGGAVAATAGAAADYPREHDYPGITEAGAGGGWRPGAAGSNGGRGSPPSVRL